MEPIFRDTERRWRWILPEEEIVPSPSPSPLISPSPLVPSLPIPSPSGPLVINPTKWYCYDQFEGAASNCSDAIYARSDCDLGSNIISEFGNWNICVLVALPSIYGYAQYVSGPYDTLNECQVGCGFFSPSPSPLVPSPSPLVPSPSPSPVGSSEYEPCLSPSPGSLIPSLIVPSISPLVCPDCSSGCQSTYNSTIPGLTGSCGGDCANITDQTVTQVGSTCQWTAVQNGWTHELVCEAGTWYYRVWTGGIGGTLCAEWAEVDTTPPVDACPPIGGTGDGTWVRSGGGCSGNDFDLSVACPSDCSGCIDPITAVISGATGSGPSACCGSVSGATISNSGTCVWTGLGSACSLEQHGLQCITGDIWQYEVWAELGGPATRILRWTAPNVTGCPPASGWTFDAGGSVCSGSPTLTLS